MGNGWKSVAILGLAFVGMLAFTSDADAFWWRRGGCGHHRHGCGHQASYGHGGCCGHVAAAPCCEPEPVACCEPAPAPCCEPAPVACCEPAPAPCCGHSHHGGYGGHRCGLFGRRHHGGYGGGGCCGGGGHVHHGGYSSGCDSCGGGGGYVSHGAPVSSGGCTNCQAPW